MIQTQFVVVVANFRELLADDRLNHLIVRSLFGVDDLRLDAEFFVLDVKGDGGIFENGFSLQHDVVSNLSGGANPDLDSVVGRLQVVTRLG